MACEQPSSRSCSRTGRGPLSESRPSWACAVFGPSRSRPVPEHAPARARDRETRSESSEPLSLLRERSWRSRFFSSTQPPHEGPVVFSRVADLNDSGKRRSCLQSLEDVVAALAFLERERDARLVAVHERLSAAARSLSLSLSHCARRSHFASWYFLKWRERFEKRGRRKGLAKPTSPRAASQLRIDARHSQASQLAVLATRASHGALPNGDAAVADVTMLSPCFW